MTTVSLSVTFLQELIRFYKNTSKIIDIKAMLLRCMFIIAKFEEEHPGCVVKNMQLTTAGGFSMSCDVMVVPRASCWTLDEEATHRDGELVVSVAPRYAFEGDWPLVELDVYVHVDEMQGLYATLSSDIPDASSNAPENVVPQNVVPMACVHVGQASLSAALGEQKTNRRGDQLLYCQYNLNLGFEDEASASFWAECLKLQFQVRKNARPRPLTRTHSGSRTMGLTGASLADNIEALKAFI